VAQKERILAVPLSTVNKILKVERPYADKHLFTNTLRCADCGKGMHFKKNRKGYVCGTYNKHGEKACTDHLVLEADLTLAVFKDIESLLRQVQDQSLLNKLEARLKKQFVNIDKQLHTIEREIKNIQNQKTKLIQLFAIEVITQDDYRDVINQNEDKMKHLVQTKTDLTQKILNKNNHEQLDKLKKELTRLKTFETLTPKLLLRLIDRIEIKADGTARIFYRFSLPSAII
jgi:Skp family chaperone for outer membrane proteins